MGNVNDKPDINSIYWSRFQCYYSLVRMYDGDPRVRDVVLNNIAFGCRAGRFFAALKERLYGTRQVDSASAA